MLSMATNLPDGQLSGSGYANRRKELLKLVNDLRAIGAQADLDLPRIAVIGNQSAGKSSVVEAISGITVPRDAGTCTRCPMELRLASSSAPWRCQISLRREYDADGRRKNDVSEVPFGEPFFDPARVEPMLRRAQAAVLHPDVSIAQVLAAPLEDIQQGNLGGDAQPLKFSRNAVCLDLAGPDLTDLSFIDLPGIIQNEEPEIVNLVESLVVSHIKGNCLILVALPMTDDIENQKALQLAKIEDPYGRRTIGVLTKPDMIGKGASKSRALWKDVFEDRRHPLTHGYYCTRQPDDDERASKISFSEARTAEMKFFSETEPWASSTHNHRFGTQNLVTTLSKLLTQIIDDALPGLQAETRNNLENCQKQLVLLPPAIDVDPASHLMDLVTHFCTDTRLFVYGGPNAARLIHANHAAFAAFKTAIRSTAPNFLPYPHARAVGRFVEEGEEEGVRSAMPPTYLDDVRAALAAAITRELPGNIPFAAKAKLIQATQATWEGHLGKCFEAVRQNMLGVLNECIKQRFGRFDYLAGQMRLYVGELLKTQAELCMASLMGIIRVEQTPYTQNTHYLQEYTDKYLARYKDARAGRGTGGDERPAKKARTEFVFGPGAQDGSKANPIMLGEAPEGTAAAAKDRDDTPTPAKRTKPLRGSFGQPAAASSSTSGVSSGSAFGSSGGAFGSGGNTSGGGLFGSGTAFSGFGSSSVPAKEATTPSAGGFGGFGFNTGNSSTDALVPPPEKTTNKVSQADPELLKEALAALAKAGYVGLTAEDLGKLNPPDIYETELTVMAEVRAYFEVSYKRVIDYIPMHIDTVFVKGIADKLQPHIVHKLDYGSADTAARFARYLAEDPNVAARRDELVGRQKRLESALAELHDFGL